MKVVCLSFTFIDYTIQLANGLSKRATVMLILPKGAVGEHLNSIDSRVDLQVFGEGRVHSLNLRYALGFCRVLNLIYRFKPDVIHIQGAFHPWFGFAAPFLKRYPVVSTFHDVKLHLGEESTWAKFHDWSARKFSSQIIVHGEKLREQMITEYNLPSSKVNAIHIGEHEVAPFKEYEGKDIAEDGNMILFFGRIYRYKGLEYLIKAEPAITREVPNAKIVIAGVGEDFRRYEGMMGDRKNAFTVHNYRISYKEGAELFQRCSVVVLPYVEASQSGVIPTAYSFSKPVVVTNVGSIPEIVEDGKTGLIVPPRDPKALSEAIIRLLKDDRLRQEMGENAHRKLQEDFSWDRIAEKTIMVYEKAMADTK
jgi:glycosyltransferase involved in cell wall biosynthesis